MQVTETAATGLKREYRVVVPATDLEARVNQRLDDLKGKVQLRGFRPGKVPVEHLKRLYGKTAMAEVIDAAVREANGKIVAKVVPKNPQRAIVAHIDNHVEPDTRLVTDDARVYDRLGRDGWNHDTINHSDKVYVVGDVHTSTIEGFWSLVKRGISGTHHAVSPKWLQGYLNEYVWRYNHRDDRRAMFALLLLRAARPTL